MYSDAVHVHIILCKHIHVFLKFQVFQMSSIPMGLFFYPSFLADVAFPNHCLSNHKLSSICVCLDIIQARGFVVASYFFTYVHTCNMYAHMTIVSLHLAATFISHIYAHKFVTVSETKCLSNVCTNVGSIHTLQ